MKHMLFALSMLLITGFGCTDPAASAAPDPSVEPNQTVMESKKDVASSQANSMQNPPSPADPKPVQPPKQGQHRNYPARMYQLDELDTTTIKVAGKSFTAWVMDTDLKRAEGMMFTELSDIKDHECMLFVFKQAEPRSFWMANCKFDLDVLYIGADKKIVRATTMKAFDEHGVPSNGPAKYVLEFKPGTIKRVGIQKGMSVEIPNDVQALD